MTKKERFYASKPPACSSPIVTTINGKTMRVHDGHRLGELLAVSKSAYTTDLNEIRLTHTFDKNEGEEQ